MNCICGHDELRHGNEHPKPCGDPSCSCWGYEKEPSPRPDYSRIVSLLETTEEKVEYLLKNLPEFRNLSNHEFLFVYWQINDNLNISTDTIKRLTDYQAVERVKRLLVAKNEEYKPTSENLIDNKGLMEYVVQEYCISK